MNEEVQSKDIKASIFLVYTFLLVSPIFMVAICLVTAVEQWYLYVPPFDDFNVLFLVFLSFAAFRMGAIGVKKLLDKLAAVRSLKTRLINYSSFLVLKFAWWETVCLISMLFLRVTDNIFYIIFPAFFIVKLLIHFPLNERICKDLSLNTKESLIFYNDSAIIE